MSTSKKVTKKETRAILKKAIESSDVTAIYRIAVKNGIDVSEEYKVNVFIQNIETSQKRVKKAQQLIAWKKTNAIVSPLKKEFKRARAIEWAKFQKTNGYMETSYGKVLIIGNTNIYWASPDYEHKDYNKSVAFENNKQNRDLATTINKYLMK